MSEVSSHGAYNTQPSGLEKVLDETFRQKAPFQLPHGFTKWVADNSWWLVLVGAVLSALGVFSTLNAINSINNALLNTSMYLDAYGMSGYVEQSKNLLYISIVTSAISAILLFMASSKLKQHQKAGWNLLYYNFLISLVVSLVGYVLFGLSTLVASLLGLAIGFVIGVYILFQLRPHFVK